MPDRFNRLKNADFTDGVKKPLRWGWWSDSDAVAWRLNGATGDETRDIEITCDDAAATGYFAQRVACKPDHWYRIETVVSCACDSSHEAGGVALWIAPELKSGDTVSSIQLVRVLRSDGFLTMRSYFRTPADSKAFELRIGMSRARGKMSVRSALVIPNIDPDVKSHPLALPPPPYAYPAPRKKVRNVCVCDQGGEDRPVITFLKKRFGANSVRQVRTSNFSAKSPNCDALIIADGTLPKGVRSLSSLERLAVGRIVIVSLEAFAELADCEAKVRTVTQPDDPLNAKIAWANFITRGFALHDMFPWSAPTDDLRVYRQRQLRRGAAINTLHRDLGYETVLTSQTDSESTSDQPICLYKPVEGGAIIVFDIDPVEAVPTTCEEPNLASSLLLNMLAVDQAYIGQFSVPMATEGDFYDQLKEFAQRYPVIQLSGRDRHDMMLQVGGGENLISLSSEQRPVLLIRSGLRGCDMASIFGCMYYLKQLVRPAPYANPYAVDLLSMFRIAWVPLCDEWQPHGMISYPATATQSQPEMDGEFEAGSIAAVIDLADTRVQEARVIYRKQNAAFKHQSQVIASLAATFQSDGYCSRSAANGSLTADRSQMSWRVEKLLPSVIVDPKPFDSDFHRSATAAGADLIRIEIPNSPSDFICNSIRRTDLAATLLEHVVGAQYGLLAINRRSSRVVFKDHPPLNPGAAINIRNGSAVSKRVG